MRRDLQRHVSTGIALSLLLFALACGGGRTAVVGVGNSGNRIVDEDGIAEAIAEALANNESIPPITDETLGEVFGAIVAHAKAGDPKAALIVLRTAEEQREEDES